MRGAYVNLPCRLKCVIKCTSVTFGSLRYPSGTGIQKLGVISQKSGVMQVKADLGAHRLNFCKPTCQKIISLIERDEC